MVPAPVFTVGHGARALEELLATLESARVSLLVDVRRHPGSRKHPHFSASSLERAVPERGIAYSWRGEVFGGRRKGSPSSRHPAWRVASFRAYADWMDGAEFRAALRELEEEVRAGQRIAIMCAETLWWRCHRRLMADALTMDGFEVVHLVTEKSRQRHKLHDDVRRDAEGHPVYDGGQERLL